MGKAKVRCSLSSPQPDPRFLSSPRLLSLGLPRLPALLLPHILPGEFCLLPGNEPPSCLEDTAIGYL